MEWSEGQRGHLLTLDYNQVPFYSLPSSSSSKHALQLLPALLLQAQTLIQPAMHPLDHLTLNKPPIPSPLDHLSLWLLMWTQHYQV